jgi:Zn-dependent protease
VLLLEPNRTPYDLHFYVGDIHVRVHPLFWVVALIISAMSDQLGVAIVIGVAAVFVSILVHELGHALTMQFFGERARIVLYMMGGFATTGGDSIWDFGSYRQRPRTPLEQVVISAAGPLAGFLLAGLVVTLVMAMGGNVHFFFIREAYYLPLWIIEPPPGQQFHDAARSAIHFLLWINIYWGILNLMPVYPLDGGQIVRPICVALNPWRGLQISLWISVIVGAALAILSLTRQDFFLIYLFGSLAFGSYQALQQMGGGGYGRPW